MKTAFRAFAFAVAVSLFVPALQAATYFVPSDAELIQVADDIVVATGLSSVVERDARGSIVTRYTLRIEDVLKGERAAGQHIELVERGGALDGKVKYIAGTPEYQPGVKYLVFAEMNLDGISRTYGMALGQFFYAAERSHSLLLRAEVAGFDNNLDSHVERARDANGFLQYIRGVVAGNIHPTPGYFVEGVNAEWQIASNWKVSANATRTSYLMQSGGMGFRWQNATQSWVRNGTLAAPANSPAAVESTSQGFAQWNSTGTDIAFSDSGVDATALGGLNNEDGKNGVLFGDPNNEINGAAGVGGVYGDITYPLGSETFIRVFEGDLVIEGGAIAQNCLNSVMTHEMGHTLGFRHSNTPPAGGVSTTDAIMNSAVQCSWNGVLKAYDQEAAQTVYGTGPVCTPPNITTEPQNKNIGLNTSTTLTVAATGTAPLSYQWYQGNTGNTSTPATGPTATTSTLSFTGTTVGDFPFWVRVSNACSPADDSSTATISVTCSVPNITTQPQSLSVPLGQSTSLSVVATGANPLFYQWYRGNAGDTSAPVGTNSATLSLTGAAVGTVGATNYWVRVTNGCPSGTDDSDVATVTVTCTPPSITVNPGSPTITEGGNTTLQVTAIGSFLTYQWFIGNTGDTSTPTGSNSSSLNVSPTTTTSYWVRVTGACGSPQNSATATVTVVPCADMTLSDPTGTPAGTNRFTLSIFGTSTATPINYVWFRGNTPNIGGTQVGTGSTITVNNVTTVTSYWVRANNACGRIVISSLVTVGPCTLPSITSQPQDQSIGFGQTATLTLGTAGTNTVKWYRGLLGDKSNQIGTGLSVTTPSLTTNTQFWAEVSNTCGPISSRQVLVTVAQTTDTLPMLNARFTVEVFYTNQFENPPTTGKLLGRSLASSTLSDTAVFTFNDPLTIEMMVRLSDARPFENKIHVFYGGLSDVEFDIRVTDSLTGTVRQYHKPPNQLIGEIDRVTFTANPGAGLISSAIDSLMAQTAMRGIAPNVDSSTLRMLNSRYEVRVKYRNQFVNPPVEGYLLGRSIASSTLTETAVWFLDPQSVEWMVRFSDARPFANRIDFFHGGLSDLQFTIEVTDTVTGVRKDYQKLPNNLEGLVDRQSWQP